MASAGHDWIVLGIGWMVGLVGSLASAAVAIVAVWLANRSAQKLGERQSRIEEAKLTSELFDRRYEAWMDLRKLAEKRYQAILGMNPEDKPQVVYPAEERLGWMRASERMYFLFPDDVNQEVIRQDDLLYAYHKATIRERNAENPSIQTDVVDETGHAKQALDESITSLKRLIKSYMRPGLG